MAVQAWNRSSSEVKIEINMPCHDLFGSVHYNHGHRSRKALLNISKSMTPSPPRCLGVSNLFPLHETVPFLFIVRAILEEPPSDVINSLERPLRQLEHSHVVEYYRGKHQFD
jgi:hypothetical protein